MITEFNRKGHKVKTQRSQRKCTMLKLLRRKVAFAKLLSKKNLCETLRLSPDVSGVKKTDAVLLR